MIKYSFLRLTIEFFSIYEASIPFRIRIIAHNSTAYDVPLGQEFKLHKGRYHICLQSI